MSDTIHAQFAKAQFEFAAPKKDKQNPHLKNMYADLASCLEAVRGPLKDNGLFLHQVVSNETITTQSSVLMMVVVHTMVCNDAGQSLSFGNVAAPVSKNDAQGYGSALTYARRYGVLSLGLAPEDDDGNAAVAPPHAQPKARSSAPPPAPPAEEVKEYTPAEARKKLYIAASSQNIGYEGKHITKWDSGVRQAWVARLGEHFEMPFVTAAQIDAIAAKFRKAINDITTLRALPGYGHGGLNSEE